MSNSELLIILEEAFPQFVNEKGLFSLDSLDVYLGFNKGSMRRCVKQNMISKKYMPVLLKNVKQQYLRARLNSFASLTKAELIEIAKLKS